MTSLHDYAQKKQVHSSCYEGINVEDVRYRCGAALARNDDAVIDMVAGIPDSGIAHAIGYAIEAKVPYKTTVCQIYTDVAAKLYAAEAGGKGPCG